MVTAAYVATSAVFLYLVPLERVASGEAFAAQAGEALFGRAGGTVFAAIVIVSVAGSLLALLMALPRVYYAMGRDGVFPASIGEVSRAVRHPGEGHRDKRPGVPLVLAGSFDQIVAYFVFITVTFIAMTVAGVYVLRGAVARCPYLTPGYPVTPAIFLSLVVLLLVLIGHAQPVAGIGGHGSSSPLGLPVFELMERRRQPSRSAVLTPWEHRMTWIKTVNSRRRRRDAAVLWQRHASSIRRSTPIAVATASTRARAAASRSAHSLIPRASSTRWACSAWRSRPTFRSTRRQHEMIATVVSAVNRCFY